MYHKVITPAAASKAAATAVETRSKELRKIGTILIIVGVVLVGISLLFLHPALLTIPLSLAITPVVDSKSVNKPGGNVVRNRSKFNLSYKLFDTYQFGKIKPCFALRSVPDDTLILHSGHDARSYTLAGVLLQNLRMHKAYFNVPLQAILPFNHDKFIANPTIGEDVPEDVGLTVRNFLYKWFAFIQPIYNKVQDSSNYISSTVFLGHKWLSDVFLAYAYGAYVFSNGSLLASLGAHYAPCFNVRTSKGSISFDMFWEYAFQKIAEFVPYFDVDNQFRVFFGDIPEQLNSTDQTLKYISFHEFISDNVFDELPVVSYVPSNPVTGWQSLVTSVFHTPYVGDNEPYMSNLVDDDPTIYVRCLNYQGEYGECDDDLNLERLWAYQLVCAHFFSNDKVDYIFSAELFRQLISDYIYSQRDFDVFTVNGFSYQYDYLSAHFFDGLVLGSNYYSHPNYFGYFSALFSFKNSLKFMDYFTGSKTRPFAVGDVTVDTSSGQVSVVDLSKTSWAAKFLQAVNRFGSKFENYIAGIFGKRPAYDYHNPMYLGEVTDVIYSTETENTGAAQMDENVNLPITSQFRSNGDRFGFRFESDRFGVCLCLVYFDVERVYSTTTERDFFDVDRFDYFNPFTQFIGDQEIKRNELKQGQSKGAFSYTGRYMQYKQRYSQAAGGFVEFLPGTLFLADKNSPTNLTPRYIRSHPSELDRFYKSLTGNTLAGYFHFFIKNDNNCSASRPMAFNPTISL